jgi:hypothetical protein
LLAPVDPWTEFLWACRATWRELPAVIGVSLALLLSAVPLLVAAMVAAPALMALAGLPLAIVTTAVIGSFGRASGGDAVCFRLRASSDVTLGMLCWASVIVIAWLGGQGSVGLVAGSMLGALGGLVLPVSLCYGAVRGRRGLAALRGGAIIAILHPRLALTIAASICLAAFACVASAGTLLVVAPALVGLAGCRMVRLALHEG